MASKKDVATTEDQNQLPAYLKGMQGQGSGLKGLDSNDVKMPRIKLLQGTSPEPTVFDTAKPGIFWHSILDMPIGTEFRFIVAALKKKYLLQTPINDPRGILARADDAKNWNPASGEFEIKLKGKKEPVIWKLAPTVAESGLAKFGSSNPDDPDSPPAATLFYDYLITLPDWPQASPVVMSLARTATRPARDLNGKIELRGLPVHAQLFEASVATETGDDGGYFNWRFKSAGIADEEQFLLSKNVAERFSDFQVADEAEAAREAAAPAEKSAEDTGAY